MPAITRRPAVAALVAVLAGAAAAPALLSSAEAQAPGTRTISYTELERGSTLRHIRNTPTRSRTANLLGDLIVFTNPLADASGRHIGRLAATCVTTTGARDFTRSTLTCSGIVTLADGTLTIQANSRPGEATSTGAVTGGTGAYAGAGGVMASKAGSAGAATTLTLLR